MMGTKGCEWGIAMNPSNRPRLAELKVGIFVLVTCVVLAMAIFTIGSQVGLFEETFFAKTYLNNTSGLKPGDIVLLAGVEVGNVLDVSISEAGQLPSTQSNGNLLRIIDELRQESEQLQQQTSETEQNFQQTRQRYREGVEQFGSDSSQARTLQREMTSAQDVLNSQRSRLQDIQGNIHGTEDNLQNIVVQMQIRSQYREWIRQDSSISLGSIGLLGDKFIEISLGRNSEAPAVDQDLVDSWWGETSQEFEVITGTTQAGFQELIRGADDVLANLETLSDKLNDVLVNLSEGEGSVGRFVTDVSFYENLNQTIVRAGETVDEATHLINTLREGEGTIARLIQRNDVYDRVDRATIRLEQVLVRVEEGKGSFGRFVNDSSLYERSNQVVENIQRITGRIEAGEGTLGKLSADDQIYSDLRDSLDQFAGLISDVEQGKGTLGRLAKDEQLYQNLNQSLSEALKLLYDFRQNPKKFLTFKLELF